VSSLNATSKMRWIPQHWRRSLVAHLLLLAVVAGANVYLAHTRAHSDGVPARQSPIADANRVTTSAVNPKARLALVADAGQADPNRVSERD
jgi:hypothetical protein